MTSIVGLLLLLAVGGAIVKAVGRTASPGTGAHPDTTGAFVYLAMYVALLTFAIGLSGVLAGILDRPTAGRAVTAGELSSTVIGLPVFIALARTTLRRLRAGEAEREANGWSLYVNVALLTTLGVATIALFWLVDGMLQGRRVGTELALVAVWAPLWFLHWRTWAEIGDLRRPDVNWLVAATAGIVAATTGGVWLVVIAVRRIVDSLATASAAVRTGSDDLEHAGILLGIGAAVWWWHWLRTGTRREGSTARLTYLLIIGVLGGVAMMYVGAVGSLVSVLVWFFGEPDTSSARTHFDTLIRLGPVSLGGAALWLYHRAVLGPRRTGDRTEIDRLYNYLVAAVAALVTTGALITLGVVVLSLLAPASAVSSDAATSNIVLAAIALLLFGGPTWYLRWSDLERRVAADEAESRSRVRRLYLLVLLAVAGTVAFAAGIATLSAVLGAVTGERGGSVAGNLRVPLASLVGAGALGVYHLRLYLSERHRFARARVREVTLVVPAGTDTGPLDVMAGVVVTRLDAARSDNGPVDLAAVMGAIEASDADRILAIARHDGVEVIPLA